MSNWKIRNFEFPTWSIRHTVFISKGSNNITKYASVHWSHKDGVSSQNSRSHWLDFHFFGIEFLLSAQVFFSELSFVYWFFLISFSSNTQTKNENFVSLFNELKRAFYFDALNAFCLLLGCSCEDPSRMPNRQRCSGREDPNRPAGPWRPKPLCRSRTRRGRNP